jgi:hypothetical protein
MDTLVGRVPISVALSYEIVLENSKDASVQMALNKLRIMYELTGVGQIYINKMYNDWMKANSALGAKYLVYNDPASMDVYVRSSAELVLEMTEAIDEVVSYNEAKNEWAVGVSKAMASRGN